MQGWIFILRNWAASTVENLSKGKQKGILIAIEESFLA